MKRQVRGVIISSLFMLPLVSGCPDGKGEATEGSSTSGGDTSGNGMTDGSPTEGSPTEGGTTGGSTGSDNTTDDDTTGGSTGGDGTTGDPGDTSLCPSACDKLVACEIEETVRECVSWCEELENDIAMLDPRVFPGCVERVAEFLQCTSMELMCFETEPCAGLLAAIEEDCGCEMLAEGDVEGKACTYHERCGVVSRDVDCTGDTCVCKVNGEVVGECEHPMMVCEKIGPDGDVAAAAGECCGWEPFEL